MSVFRAILGSHFAGVGSLADGFMDLGLIGLVKRFRDVCPEIQAFSRVGELAENGICQSCVADGLVPMIDGQLACDYG